MALRFPVPLAESRKTYFPGCETLKNCQLNQHGLFPKADAALGTFDMLTQLCSRMPKAL
jgi:hypothetical protein